MFFQMRLWGASHTWLSKVIRMPILVVDICFAIALRISDAASLSVLPFEKGFVFSFVSHYA